jgi:protein-S-isoprenylcysteine O-methyltransferase Ste14
MVVAITLEARLEGVTSGTMMTIRQLVSIVLLPVTVTVLVPMWIARRTGTTVTAPTDVASVLAIGVGIGSAAVGLTLFTWSLYYFWTRGRGTLAPWDPPRRFVVSGPYRFVRNPMISGVIFLLIAEACVLRSRPHAEWAGLFTLINLVYIPLIEEPLLRARFGAPYERYVKSVRRFVPRIAAYADHV